jgi:hypothetical protein
VNPEERQQSQSQEPSEPKYSPAGVYEWVGDLVILSYARGPYPDNPWEIHISDIKAISGLYELIEVSGVGVMVRKVKELGKLEDCMFISWGSLHFIEGLSEDEEEGQEES